jgi:hypothetical protein
MSATTSHRLKGLEPDNLLAFLALLGTLRALELVDGTRAENEKLRPRAGWDVDTPPLRPRLFVAIPCTQGEVCEAAARGVAAAATAHDFDGRKDLNYSRDECRLQLERAAESSSLSDRVRADLFAALMTDAAVKDDKKELIDPTALCLLFGQGHQHFLERLSRVPGEPTPPSRGKGKNATALSPAECLAEALFHPWHRKDSTFSFRWDPEEDVRYALMAGDPTDAAYKSGTQHGANRLAAVALGALTIAPEHRAGRIRPTLIGGAFDSSGFSFSWPIWREPATLAAIRSLLSHPHLLTANALEHLGIDQVMTARRISVGKFMNFTRASAMSGTAV